MVLALCLTLSAICHAVRKPLLPQVLEASVISRKLTVEIFDCVPKVGRNRLSAVHDVTNLAKTQRDVKG
jgi:hypothetical protein